jgi:hypothetical protein
MNDAAVQHGCRLQAAAPQERKTRQMEDLGYVVLTLAVFGVLFLILKGIERFER